MSSTGHDDGRITVRRIDDPRRIARKFGGKGAYQQAAPQQPTESPNTLRSRSTARIIEVLSEGRVYGFTTQRTIGQFWASVFLDDTPVQGANGEFTFAIREGFFRYGLPEQDPVPGFAVAEAEFAVGVQMKYLDPVVRTTNTPISAVRYKVRVQSLFHAEKDGDVTGHSVVYAFDYNIDGGGWVNAVTEAITGKTVSPYERQVRVQLPYTTGTVQIRAIRLTPDEATSEFQNNIFFSSYTEVVDGQMSYDDTAIVGFTVDAEEFQSLPTRSYLVDGICVEIPSNYDPWTRVYSGDWDGTFYTQWTNNPAWLLYAFLTNKRYGLGNHLDVAAIDKWSFYQAAQYNDQGVPDGRGGIDIRFTCNTVINTRQDAFAVLQALASNMRCLLYFANGTIFLVQDRELLTPERTFGPADVVDGIFEYGGTDVRSRHTAVAVTWNDPDDRYEPAVELVLDPAMVAQQGYKETQVVAFGCTSRAQAQRFGRWLIYTSQFETEVASFKVGLENADLRPGMLIGISDPSRVGARLAGRLLDNDHPTQMTLDRVPPEVPSGGWLGWYIIVTVGTAADPHNPPRLYEFPINQVNVDTGMVSVGIVKPEPLPAGSMWLIRSGAVAVQTWRVNAVADRDAGVYEVTATEYHVEKFTYVDNNVLIPPPPFSLIPTGPLLPPTDFAFIEFIYLDGSGFPQFGILLSWSASPDPRITRYQIEMAGPAGDYRIFRNINGIGQEVLAMREGEWYVTLQAFDQLGRRAPIVPMRFTPIGRTVRPLPPTALFITAQGPTSTLIWLPTGEIDVVYYWVKWHPSTDGTATWERAVTSIARVDRNTTQITTPTRSGTFMVKAIDALGQESVGWSAAILVEQITDDVHIIDIVEQPDWGGNLGTNWHRNLGALLLPPPVAPEPVPPDIFAGDRAIALNQTPTRLGVYLFEDELDLGLVSSVSMIGITEGFAQFMGVVMARWVPLAAAVPLAMGVNNSMSVWRPLALAVPLAMSSPNNSGNWDAHIEVRISQDGTTFAPWEPLKSALLTGRRFQWRMIGTLFDLATTLRMVRAVVSIQIPLRNLSGNDVALDGTGHLTITYAVPFLVAPNVQITARQGLSAGGNIVLIQSTADHFRVEHRNAAGAATAGGSIDYFVQGYGGGIPLAMAA